MIRAALNGIRVADLENLCSLWDLEMTEVASIDVVSDIIWSVRISLQSW